MADGYTYSIDGGVFSCRSSPPEVLRVVSTTEKGCAKHLEISLIEPPQNVPYVPRFFSGDFAEMK